MHLAHRHALRSLIIASAERLESLFVQAKLTRFLCIWTIHVHNENKSAIVIPTIRGEGATHFNCFQLFHTCLQRNIVHVEMVNFTMVKVDNFCKSKSIAVYFKLFDGKNTGVVVSKSER